MYLKEDLFNVIFELLALNKTMSLIQLEIATGVNKITISNLVNQLENIHVVSTEEIKVEYQTRTKKAKMGKVSVFELGNIDKRVTLNESISKEDYIQGLGLGLMPTNLKKLVIIDQNIVKELSSEHFFQLLEEKEKQKKREHLKRIRGKVSDKLGKEEWFKIERDILKSIQNHKKKTVCNEQDLILMYSILEVISSSNKEKLELEFKKELSNIGWVE